MNFQLQIRQKLYLVKKEILKKMQKKIRKRLVNYLTCNILSYQPKQRIQKMTKMTKRNITGKKKGLGRYIKRRTQTINTKTVKQICEERLQELRNEIEGIDYSDVRPTWSKDYDLAYSEYLKIK